MGSKRTKYGVDPKDPRLIVDCTRFDSVSEAKRYGELKLLHRAGEITYLHVHPIFDVVWPKTGEKICRVELDFHYIDKEGVDHYEDVKGVDTALSKLKRKIVEASHKIKVEIVR